MKIRVNVSDLRDALKVASAVRPGSSSANSGAGYVFTSSDGRCFLNSANDNGYVRVEVPVLSLEGGEAPFVYPADRVDAIQYMVGWVDIESGETDGSYWYKYRTEEGASGEAETFDPSAYPTLDTFLGEDALETVEFPTALLREGLSTTSQYLADKAEPNKPFKTIQLFDQSNPEWAKGDGTMYASDGLRACYFHSPSFAGKGLAVHEKHLGNLSSFLSKCHPTVKIRKGETMTFAVDQIPNEDGTFRDGSVFGWIYHASMYDRYRYYSPKFDRFVLSLRKDQVLRNLKWLQVSMKGANKVRMIYSNGKLRFVGGKAETAELEVKSLPLEDGGVAGPEFSANAHIQYLVELFSNVRSHEIELRIALLENRPLFRTVDRFRLGSDGKVSLSEGHECQVTYFTTALD